MALKTYAAIEIGSKELVLKVSDWKTYWHPAAGLCEIYAGPWQHHAYSKGISVMNRSMSFVMF